MENNDHIYSGQTALVTGGGGFVGREIVERLTARGMRVRTLARGAYRELATLGVQVVQGDLRDRRTVLAACHGCDVVFHVAARAGAWGRFVDFYEPNVIGTENVIAGCRKHGVGRLVFTSSPSVIFGGEDQTGIDESVGYPERFASHYSATKALAEQLVLKANDRTLRTIALRPHLVWGPGDNHIVPRVVAQGRSGTLRIIGDGSQLVDVTYIDNAADAHLCAFDAMTRNDAVGGRAYFISQGEPVKLWDIINGILEAAGLPKVTKRIPRGVAKTAAGAMECVHRILRLKGEPRLTRFVVEQMSTTHYFNIDAARRDLGYEPKVSTEEGLVRLGAWFNDRGKTSRQP
ncbi:MAG TPA: NAD-dependent epimerase/dehydratase family protein [Phycisphaerae bacterium]|nr:NAD-dependent epimerase/dehydratase family protein [Phycisphaerae bacterium]